MNASPMLRLLAALFLGLCLAAGLSAQTEAEKPEAKERPIREIKLRRLDLGWELWVHRDGSGSAVYGSSFGDNASFPKGTVDFEALLQAAKTSKIADRDDPERVTVRLSGGGNPDYSSVAKAREMTAAWDAACRQIQPHLRASSPERINWILERNPLAKGLPYVPARKVEPPPPQPKRIRISRGKSEWNMVIEKDGSGSMAHGAAYGVIAWFPKGTVNFGSMVEQSKNRKAAEGAEADSKEAESVAISIEQTSGAALGSQATSAEWETLCRQIQPHLRSAKPEQFNQLLKDHPLAKNLPEASVGLLEPPSKSDAPAAPKGD